MAEQPELPALRRQLADLAREIARELIKPDPDQHRVAELDAEREVLLEKIRRATPPRPEYDLLR